MASRRVGAEQGVRRLDVEPEVGHQAVLPVVRRVGDPRLELDVGGARKERRQCGGDRALDHCPARGCPSPPRTAGWRTTGTPPSAVAIPGRSSWSSKSCVVVVGSTSSSRIEPVVWPAAAGSWACDVSPAGADGPLPERVSTTTRTTATAVSPTTAKNRRRRTARRRRTVRCVVRAIPPSPSPTPSAPSPRCRQRCIALVSTNSSRPYLPRSRPMPDCL